MLVLPQQTFELYRHYKLGSARAIVLNFVHAANDAPVHVLCAADTRAPLEKGHAGSGRIEKEAVSGRCGQHAFGGRTMFSPRRCKSAGEALSASLRMTQTGAFNVGAK